LPSKIYLVLVVLADIVDSGWGGVAMTTGLRLPIAILKQKKRSKEKHLLLKQEVQRKREAKSSERGKYATT
jgi:hypothetical protein